jgi:D-tagatose-1,6-bisphosphate aldolase subunit GatZ/KbaZ
LAQIEEELEVQNPSNIRSVMHDQMATHPGNWQNYYSGTEDELRIQRIYSYSDRIRYYWANDTVSAALSILIDNLKSKPIPETIVSQEFTGLEFGDMPNDPNDLIQQQVQRCIRRYFKASGH